jgi:hypothetical protein
MVRSSPRVMDPLFFAQASLPAVVFSLDAAVACGLQIRCCLRSSLPHLWSLPSSSIHRCSVSCVTGSIYFFDRLGSHASSARITWLLRLSSGLFVLLDLICSDQLKKEKKKKKRELLFLSAIGCSWQLLFVALHCHSKNSRVLKKNAHAAFVSALSPLPLLLLHSRYHHGLFFDFFRLCPSLVLSGAFRWHQLS